MTKKKQSPGEKAFYLRYKAEDRYRKNRIKKLEKHVKANPEDEQARIRLANSAFEYRRNKSGHTIKYKDAKDKFRLLMYTWKKAYPPAKKTSVLRGSTLAGHTFSMAFYKASHGGHNAQVS